MKAQRESQKRAPKEKKLPKAVQVVEPEKDVSTIWMTHVRKMNIVVKPL